MAWDKAEKELDDLNGDLRRLRQQFRDQEQTLLNRINQKKRLQQSLLTHAPGDAGSR
jgi:predicted  nucleic acid-binding Zn-ribbon protein